METRTTGHGAKLHNEESESLDKMTTKVKVEGMKEGQEMEKL